MHISSIPSPRPRASGPTSAEDTDVIPGPDQVWVWAGKLFDPRTGILQPRRIVVVNKSSGLVQEIKGYKSDLAAEALMSAHAEAGGENIDCMKQTVLPGLVDAHVHLFLHPYSEVSWDDQVTKWSLAERTIRATVNARKTLMAGYTTVRDLGTEGAGDADIALRNALSGPDALIPGPRYFCANRAIVPTGAYGPKSSLYVNQNGVDGVTGAEVADGVDECVKAVRRQIGAGADWIKIYAEYSFRSRHATVSSASRAPLATFNDTELKAIIDTAHALGVKVAAHAVSARVVSTLVRLGIDTIEHGWDVASSFSGPDNVPPILSPEEREAVRLLSDPSSHTRWVPTLAVYEALSSPSAPPRGRKADDSWAKGQRTFRNALAAGVPPNKIAAGGDTGAFAHGANAREIVLLHRLGLSWAEALRAATLGAWEAVRSMRWEGAAGRERLARVGEMEESEQDAGANEVPFGVLERGWLADLVATEGDVVGDLEGALRPENVGFVMKGGRVYKRDGREVV
ncbi:hypothetical protein CONPUDRAFT_79452 [Coniophora puteana RWD-64-598 SS2]|uniref:Amidohydrolase-related domain-containing protein n=1 Tax=Coniophora puteana (strain RWD-64-598) TaxID=741705 RepID=A0A5M3N8H8_CONPW|nr:uncharacterized protein CONPUDRAFT_79452 [Coniophora puteana RWD-64-598 SS2]EIW87414.1 hypothetical protein CONPUDRAFT_79452 [Coniophora puteana RWD-64-598 SS2]